MSQQQRNQDDQLQPLTEEDLQQMEADIQDGRDASGRFILPWVLRQLRRLIAEVRRLKEIEAAYTRYCQAQAEATIQMSPYLRDSIGNREQSR